MQCCYARLFTVFTFIKSPDDTRLLQYNHTHLYTHQTGWLLLNILLFIYGGNVGLVGLISLFSNLIFIKISTIKSHVLSLKHIAMQKLLTMCNNVQQLVNYATVYKVRYRIIAEIVLVRCNHINGFKSISLFFYFHHYFSN